MSDIVERLRQVAAAYKSLPTSGIWATMTVDRDASCNNLTDAADEIERLRAEVAGLREDAGRYRHMRNNSQFQSRNGPGLYWYLPRGLQGEEGEQLDAAIDAALAARKGEA